MHQQFQRPPMSRDELEERQRSLIEVLERNTSRDELLGFVSTLENGDRNYLEKYLTTHGSPMSDDALMDAADAEVDNLDHLVGADNYSTSSIVRGLVDWGEDIQRKLRKIEKESSRKSKLPLYATIATGLAATVVGGLLLLNQLAPPVIKFLGDKYITESLIDVQKDAFAERDRLYAKMDDALAKKDLPAFVEAYRDTSEFLDGLKALPLVTDAVWFETFEETRHQTYGEIFAATMTHPEILENWEAPNSVGDRDVERKLTALIDFVNNKRASDDHTLPKWNWMTIYDDKTLSLVRNSSLPPGTAMLSEASYLPPGTFSDFDWYQQADFSRFTLFHTEQDGVANTVRRECDVLDLGADGIDRTDAILNDIPEEEIDAANDQYGACLDSTIAQIQKRYSGTGFFE